MAILFFLIVSLSATQYSSWSSTVSYKSGDVVSYDGRLFQCVNDVAFHSPLTDYWRYAHDLGYQYLPWNGQYYYKAGATVLFGEQYYQSVLPVKGFDPTTSYWKPVSAQGKVLEVGTDGEYEIQIQNSVGPRNVFEINPAPDGKSEAWNGNENGYHSCVYRYSSAQEITLKATPYPGEQFAEWMVIRGNDVSHYTTKEISLTLSKTLTTVVPLFEKKSRYAINCGSIDSYLSHDGVTFEPISSISGASVSGGENSYAPDPVEFGGTDDDILYHSVRQGGVEASIEYSFDGMSADSLYFVELHLSSFWGGHFSVNIENKSRIDQLNLGSFYEDPRSYKAIIPVKIADGQLNIDLNGRYPAIAAIRVYSDNGMEVFVNNIIDKWNEEQDDTKRIQKKAGQLVMAHTDNASHWNTGSPRDIADKNVGALIQAGGLYLSTPEANAQYLDNYQRTIIESGGIPMICSADFVHGVSGFKDGTVFPHNIGLGSTNNVDLVERSAQITALEAWLSGVRWNLSPCIAAPQDERWGRTYEGFGETNPINSKMAIAMVNGMQHGPTPMAVTLKHYAGDGATLYGTGKTGILDQGDVPTTMFLSEFEERHITPYKRAIEANAYSVMPSYSSIHQDLNGKYGYCHFNRWLLKDKLRDDINYMGVVVSDFGGMWQNNPWGSEYSSEALGGTIGIGIDVAMEPQMSRWNKILINMPTAIATNKLSEAQLDEAVKRVLRLKFMLQAFSNPYTVKSVYSSHRVGSPEHRNVARQLARQSMVLLKNKNNHLPLTKNKKIALLGRENFLIKTGSISGGWTISWQGNMGDDMYLAGSTIEEGIGSINGSGNTSLLVKDFNSINDLHKAIIVVVGDSNSTYAEWVGDKHHIRLSAEDRNLLKDCRQKASELDIPLITVLITGRPLDLGTENTTDGVLKNSDAVAVAWLPGSEGGLAIAEILFGEDNFKGILQHTWPKSNAQVPINRGDGQEGLFNIGYGLRYE